MRWMRSLMMLGLAAGLITLDSAWAQVGGGVRPGIGRPGIGGAGGFGGRPMIGRPGIGRPGMGQPGANTGQSSIPEPIVVDESDLIVEGVVSDLEQTDLTAGGLKLQIAVLKVRKVLKGPKDIKEVKVLQTLSGGHRVNEAMRKPGEPLVSDNALPFHKIDPKVKVNPRYKPPKPLDGVFLLRQNPEHPELYYNKDTWYHAYKDHRGKSDSTYIRKYEKFIKSRLEDVAMGEPVNGLALRAEIWDAEMINPTERPDYVRPPAGTRTRTRNTRGRINGGAVGGRPGAPQVGGGGLNRSRVNQRYELRLSLHNTTDKAIRVCTHRAQTPVEVKVIDADGKETKSQHDKLVASGMLRIAPISEKDFIWIPAHGTRYLPITNGYQGVIFQVNPSFAMPNVNPVTPGTYKLVASFNNKEDGEKQKLENIWTGKVSAPEVTLKVEGEPAKDGAKNGAKGVPGKVNAVPGQQGAPVRPGFKR